MYCGLFRVLSVIFTLPLFCPRVVGVNVTLIAQFPPGASVVELVHPPEAIAKLPVTDMPESVSGVVPKFVSVTFFAALVVPVFWFPKFK